MEVGWINLAEDRIVGQAGKAQSTTVHVVMLWKQDDQSLYGFSAV